MDFLIFVISIAILISGADMLIRSSNALALKLNISHFLMGAFLVAIGTSLPEMGVAIEANSSAKSEMAIALIIGSSILNMTLIFGAIFLFSKSVSIKKYFFKKDTLWLLVSLALFMLVLMDQKLGYFDAFILLAVVGSYLLFLIEDAEKARGEFTKEILNNTLHLPYALGMLLFGGVFLIVGSIFVVDSVGAIASKLQLDEWSSGIILIAFAAALPELILTVLAVYKEKIEIAIVNIIGSTISNLTLVVGVVIFVNPIEINLSIHLFDLATMLVASLSLIAIILTKSYNRYSSFLLLLILILFIHQTLFA